MSTDLFASESRPRYRLLATGPNALSDSELLAVLLRTGVPGKTARSLAHGLLEEFGGIAGLLYASPDRLAQVEGLRLSSRRAELLVVLELARRALGQQLRDREVVGTPDAVKHFLQLHLGRTGHEVFAVMFLDAQNRLIDLEVMFRGTLTQTSVYPREVVKKALEFEAAAVVLAHNHPSGTVQPSRADEALTHTLKQALLLIDVRVLDHVIVAPGAACSMAEKGLL